MDSISRAFGAVGGSRQLPPIPPCSSARRTRSLAAPGVAAQPRRRAPQVDEFAGSRRGLAAVLVSCLGVTLLAGCPGPEEIPPDAARPERDAAIDAAAPGDAGPSDAGQDAFSPDAFTFDAPGLDAYADDAFVASPDAFDCVAPEGCFRCAPTTSDELLDRCTTATCEPFVNDRTRLPLLNADGSLPPLP